MNFRARADMYTVAPKVQLADYVDNTMPRRDWSRYERPIRSTALPEGREFRAPRYRKPVSERETANLFITRQAG
jgi:hypothetical protein